MTSKETEQLSTATILRFAPFVGPLYGVALSLVYLQFYWGAFDVNVFPYVSASQILLLSAYGLVPIALGLGFALITSSPAGDSKLIASSKNGLIEGLRLAVFAVVFIVPAVYVSPYQLPFYVALLGSLLLIRPTVSRLRGVTTSKLAAAMVLLAIALVLVTAGVAWSSALRIKYGFSDSIARVVVDGGSTLDDVVPAAIHHLGHVGEYDFFYLPKGESVVVLPSRRVEEIVTIRRELCFRCISVAGGEIVKLNRPFGD